MTIVMNDFIDNNCMSGPHRAPYSCEINRLSSRACT